MNQRNATLKAEGTFYGGKMVVSQRLFTSWVGTLILWGTSVEATSILKRPVSDLSREAREIYRVRIQAWEYKSIRGELWTEYKAQVLEAFKGDTPSGELILLHLPGGKEGKRHSKILGLPSIQKDQEYVVFLQDSVRASGVHRLVGWSAFVVGKDQLGQRYVMSVGSSDRSHARSTALQSAEYSNIRPYEAFVEDVFLHMD